MIEIKAVSMVLSNLADILSVFGGIIIIFGGLKTFYHFFPIEFRGNLGEYYHSILDFNSLIVWALEFFLAATLINTIINPTLNQIFILGITTLIRTLAKYALLQRKEIINPIEDKLNQFNKI